ncbi:hypothetical protein MTR67_031091 [Solanum verrucosum]|uniref:Uncharacterized protein n=1 Tax=Solanum verrucosum TaxID=315347 RepID=A0AAF0U1V9_SOLVR|nr:hypothetical protein MTR67_031091 [Solanum verrucosum]
MRSCRGLYCLEI